MVGLEDSDLLRLAAAERTDSGFGRQRPHTGHEVEMPLGEAPEQASRTLAGLTDVCGSFC